MNVTQFSVRLYVEYFLEVKVRQKSPYLLYSAYLIFWHDTVLFSCGITSLIIDHSSVEEWKRNLNKEGPVVHNI